eukprot:TRINITY_DN1416_c3_g4_i3.p2 TRINITY_DN1416_c3_g4~~TRINITY_DN1416_c3_g4_i3.p2  ORF type:complete len:128 (-),score=54.03 TRINITY_DN1416_c3_g4_i3:687-1070(-)
MGACGSKNSDVDPAVAASNEAINEQIRIEKRQFDKIIKILLLGTGESGKSTIAKQMKIMHLKGFTQEELINHRQIIHGNLLECIKTLLLACKAERLEFLTENIPLAEEIILRTTFLCDFTAEQAKKY